MPTPWFLIKFYLFLIISQLFIDKFFNCTWFISENCIIYLEINPHQIKKMKINRWELCQTEASSHFTISLIFISQYFKSARSICIKMSFKKDIKRIFHPLKKIISNFRCLSSPTLLIKKVLINNIYVRHGYFVCESNETCARLNKRYDLVYLTPLAKDVHVSMLCCNKSARFINIHVE